MWWGGGAVCMGHCTNLNLFWLFPFYTYVSVSDRRYQVIEFTCYQSGLEIYSNGVASMPKSYAHQRESTGSSSDSI